MHHWGGTQRDLGHQTQGPPLGDNRAQGVCNPNLGRLGATHLIIQSVPYPKIVAAEVLPGIIGCGH